MRYKRSYIKIKMVSAIILLTAGLWYVCSYAKIGYTHVILSEICIDNDGIIYDTGGYYHDYIELYNPTKEALDISGIYLSDDKNNLTKYKIPDDTVLESGAYLLLWAGKRSEDIILEDDSFYTGFALKEGETLYLSVQEAGGEKLLDKAELPAKIEKQTAYSRILLLRDFWKMTDASPGKENNTDVKKAVLKTEVCFSKESGFYEEPFYLELTTDDTYDIYYTLDGSTPTTEALKYDGEILITDASEQENKYSVIEDISLLENVYFPTEKTAKATVIRAIAVDTKGRSSRESYATYFVDFQEKNGFDNTAVVSLITDPKNLFDYETGIYVTGKVWDMHRELLEEASEYWRTNSPLNYLCRDNGWRREAVLQYFDVSGKKIYDQQASIRLHGKSSASFNQKSFNLYAEPEMDGNTYVFEGIFGQSDKTLMLRSGGGDSYGAKLRDVLMQELVNDRAVMVSDFEPCQLFLDGEYWGLYMLQQRVCKNMISNRYQVEEDNVILLKENRVSAGEETDLALWEQVVTFAKEHDLSISENYAKMEQMIDIQSCIDHYAFQIYVANSDSLYNNNARWRVKECKDGTYEDGKWRWCLYDIDSSAGFIKGLSTAEVDSFVSGNWWYAPLEDELFAALIKNEEFKERFVVSFMDIANYNFNKEKVLSRVDELTELLTEATIQSHQRFYWENYSKDDYLADINLIKKFFEERYDYITAYMKKDLELTGNQVVVTVENGIGGIVELNTITLSDGEQFCGKYYSDYEIKLLAEAEAGYQFAGFLVNGELFAEEAFVLRLDEGKEYNVEAVWEKQ